MFEQGDGVNAFGISLIEPAGSEHAQAALAGEILEHKG